MGGQRLTSTSHLYHTPTQVINFVSSPTLFSFAPTMGTYHTGIYVRCIPDTKCIVQHMYVLPCYMLWGQGSHLIYTTWCPVWALQARWSPPFATHRKPPPAGKRKKSLRGLTGNNYRSSVAAVIRIHIRPLAVASVEHVHLQMGGWYKHWINKVTDKRSVELEWWMTTWIDGVN